MFMSTITSTRLAPPSHRTWEPHPYQSRAVDFLSGRSSGALFLDPGLGKTSIVLQAFLSLKRQGQARRMLVVAPLRVCQTVWRQEGQKWTQFRELTFALLHGSKKDAALASEHDIALINPEGLAWLCKRFDELPYDTLVLDELTKFKNQQAQRHKLLRGIHTKPHKPMLRRVRRRWGLTGTPAPNGYLDLFGQFLALDDGAALGRFITHYRAQYFKESYNGFDWELQNETAKERIEDRIRPYVLRMAADDYLDLPPVVDDVRLIELEPAALKTYKSMKDDMIAKLPEGVVVAQNAGGVITKLRQMANGAVYNEPLGGERTWHHIHDAKLDAVEELVEELAGQPLLLAYEFNSDLERLLVRFPETPYLSGTSEKRTQEIVDAWNRGEVPLLFAHPQSAGHGLNMQGSSCGHVAWLGPTWDLELYEQFIKRVQRQGNNSSHIVNHIFVAAGTVDEDVLTAVRDKGTVQSGLLTRLSAAINGEVQMTNVDTGKLGFQGQAPRGWGEAPAAANGAGHVPGSSMMPPPAGQAAGAAEPARRTRTRRTPEQVAQAQQIAGKLTGGDATGTAPGPGASLFSQGVQAQLNGSPGFDPNDPVAAAEAALAKAREEKAAREAAAKAQQEELARLQAAAAAAQPATTYATPTQAPQQAPVNHTGIDYERLANAILDALVARLVM